MAKKNPLSRQGEIVIQELGRELLIYDLTNNKAFCLNETSALVWKLCDGEKTVGEMSRELGKQLNFPANEELVWLALDQLKKDNLIENETSIPPLFNNYSRREIIRKVGLTSLIALPFIMHVTAPVAAQAQSVTCTSGANNLCFCLDTFCDPVANFGMPVPVGNPGCQDGCTVGSTCTCKGPFICSQSVGIPGTGGKTGTCKF
jgi:hypothetical protein